MTDGDLFSQSSAYQPLADRVRPDSLDSIVGQQHLLAKDKPLRQTIESGKIHSMVFWGPPGTGKTTLARLIADYADAQFLSISAVLGGIKEIRDAVERARQFQGISILFVDEVHRFNKAQQDAFLPHIEAGTIVFVGATTENPSFELNNALLSRCRVYVFKSLQEADLRQLLHNLLENRASDFALEPMKIDPKARDLLIDAADGDARRLLGFVEILSDLAGSKEISVEQVREIISGNTRRFDKQGDVFYEQISALHKSVRGSDPDAALYWFCRMLDGGCDPLYVARRVIRMASEDIGNADPRALELALNAVTVYERLGSPEGELAVAQAVIYLACAAKSNAVYSAFNEAKRQVQETGSLEVPVHLRNAPTSLMQQQGYGKEYRYAHEEQDAFAAGETYFPESLIGTRYYYPVSRGLEQKIAEKLEQLRLLNEQARSGSE